MGTEGTEGTQGNEGDQNEIEFSSEEQKFIDKLVGNARVKAREKAQADAKSAQDQAVKDAQQAKLEADKEWQKLADMNAARVTELEPFEAEAKAYRELVTGMLKDQVKVLGDAAKKAVAALPESLSDLDKLNWLNQNQELFGVEDPSGRVRQVKQVGTPAKKTKSQSATDKGRENHRRLRM